jgi:nitrogen fixation NifU-like protein
MSLGKNPDELLEITGDAILEKLGGLPKDEQHRAFLAGETLQEALNNYMIKKKHS